MRVQGMLKLAAIVLIVVVGLVHLVGAPPHYRWAPYLGVGFVVNLIGALIAAAGIYRDALWGWLLGALVAGGALVMYVVSRLVGLPGYQEHVGMWIGDSFGDRLGIPSLFVEAPLVVLSAIVVARHLGQERVINE